MPAIRLFAYGTLLTGTGDEALDRAWRCAVRDLGPGWIVGRLVRLDGYPGAIEGPGRVWGRLFELRDTRGLLRRLDRYEGVGCAPQSGAFERRITPVYQDRGQDTEDAWAYWYRGPTGGRVAIRGGRWRERR